MRYPLDGNPTVTTKFKVKGTGSLGAHLGIDRRAAVGTPVYAPGAGKVTAVSTGPSGGKQVEVRIGAFLWRFLHLNEQLVRTGQTVSEGQLIGKTGKTGVVDGPHLHYDARKDGTTWNASLSNYIDPDALVEEANRPQTTSASSKGMLHLNKGTDTTFYRVSGGTFTIHAKDDTYDYTILENQGYRVRVNSVSGGGNGWIYLTYQTGANKGKTIPGRSVR